MKNNKYALLSLTLALIMVVSAVVTPALTVSAEERNIYSKLEVKELGAEWDAWNSMNSTNLDENGYKIPTADYIEVVSDPTDSGHGGVLKIGHAKYPTSMSLRLTQPTDVVYSHKFEAQFYLDDAFTSGKENYILIKDADAWTNVGGGNQTKIGLDGITTKKWVGLNTEGLAAGNDGVSGNGYQHIDSGYITVLFQISLDAGKYLYMDNLNIAVGNNDTYQKNIDVENGDKIIYAHEFKTFEELDVTSVTKLDDWTVSNGANIGKITTEIGNTEVLVYSNSIVQKIDGIPNGKYNISIDYCNNGNTSSILTAHDITADGWKNQRNLILQDVSYGMHTATISGYEITDNCLRISVYAIAQEGKFVKVDNVTVTKEGSDENLVLNGGFELDDAPITSPTEKASRAAGWGSWVSGVGKDSIYVADTGYNSNSAMAVTYPVDGGSNVSHKITGLTAGKTYIITSHAKMSANASPTLFIKYNGGQTKQALSKSDTWTSFYKEFQLPEGCDWLTLEFYCGGTAGDWFMLDNVKVIEKDEATMTNLVTNGDFETIIGDINGDAKIGGADLIKLRTVLTDADSADISVIDVNGDKAVNVLDLIRMKKYIAGLDVLLGA